MAARSDRLYVALELDIVLAAQQSRARGFEMPRRIRTLCATAPHTLTRLAVGLDVGAQLFWDGAGQRRVRPFVEDMSEPVLGFNRSGYVAAASGAHLEVYDTKNDALIRVAEAMLPNSGPLAIFPLFAADRFGVFDQAGDVTIYEIG